jgi:adenine-specific DNA-methyltransferase
VEVKKTKDKKTIVKLLGVDYYDPTTGEVNSDELKEVAAWILDTDYDKNSVFCIRQAFFPNNNNAWQKLEKALRGVIDQEKFDALNTFGSLPFETPTSKMVAIKVIDIKGQELIKVIEL